MKRILCLVTLVISCIHTSAQYTRTQVFDLAQSHIKQFLGEHLAAHTYLTEGIRYSYYEGAGKVAYKDMQTDDIVQGNVDRIYAFYHFEYAYPGYRDTIIRGNFSVEFDKNLQIIRKPDFSFIPEYVWSSKGDEFIDWDKAIEIAHMNGLPVENPPGKQVRRSLSYWKKKQQFLYIFDLATEPFAENIEHEAWFIDAVNGTLLFHETGPKAIERFVSMME